MGFRFIYGRAGSGKSEYCFKEIKRIVNDEEKIYIITPEQFSFTSEKKLLDSLETGAVINAEVLTFNRMAYRVMSEVGGLAKTNLSKSGKAMLVYNIISNSKEKLIFLNKSEENIEIASNIIKELKKHNVSVEHIGKTLETIDDKYLKAKLNDIYSLYENYQETINKKYIDEEDILTILLNKLDETDSFKNSIIYIDEFIGFTKQEYEIIRKLAKLAKQVNITICTDELESMSKKDTDIFKTSKETYEKFIKIAKEENIPIEGSIFLEDTHRFKNDELKYLEQGLSSKNIHPYLNKVENIELVLNQNPFFEIEHVAKEIIKLVRDKKYRFNDISIVAKNIDTYSNIVKAVFKKYDIPVFIDEKKDLSQNILVKYIISIIEIFSKNWSYEAMFNYLKTGLTEIEFKDIFILENYCMKYGIKGSKWYKEDFKIANGKEDLNKLNELRLKIVEPLLNFQKKLVKFKTTLEISKALYEFLIDNGIDQQINKKAKELIDIGEVELGNGYLTSWDIVTNVLDEIVMTLGNEKISFDEYVKTLKVGLQNSGLGSIPASLDQVILGDVDRSRSHKVKAVFIIGLNDGVFPSDKKEEGFLNDKDREVLKNFNLELANGTLENLYEDNFNIYKTFSIAEEKLYLSYISSDAKGKTLRPSILISKIKKLFPSLKEKSEVLNPKDEITTKSASFEELLYHIRNWKDGEKLDDTWKAVLELYKKDKEYSKKLEAALKGLNYTNTAKNLTKENIQKLYGNVLKTSISRIEQYRNCPFSFYLKYGLQLSDKSLFKIQSLDTGTFMHDVIDEFFEQVISRDINLKEILDSDIEEIVESIVNEKLTLTRNYIFTSTAKYRLLTSRLKSVILKSIKYIIETIQKSDFSILGNEVEFKKNSTYPPIEIQLEDGKKVELTGKIDRIDLAKGKDGNFIRIIDYKSSIKNIDLNEVVAGLQIQLLTYLDAVTKIEDMIPAGVLYFNLIDPIIKSDKNKTDEEIEQEIKKQFKMQGLILADVNVVRMMDKTLDKGASNIVPAYIDSNDNLSYTRSSTVTKEQFENLQKYINKIIKQISKEILSGNIDIKPVYKTKKKKTPCEYCEYRSICNFDDGKNEYEYIYNKTREEVLDNIKI